MSLLNVVLPSKLVFFFSGLFFLVVFSRVTFFYFLFLEGEITLCVSVFMLTIG
uniref:Uncharacterized protein n=1 Tax=Anguilla anguilla TaxID=7936 RepID=A0A0E9QDY3_ANGAN